MISDMLSVISIVAAAIQATVVLITLVFVVKQTKIMRRSIDGLEKQTRVSNLVSVQAQLAQINDALIRERGLAKAFGYTQTEVIAFALLNRLELVFLLKKEGLIDEQTWRGHESYILDTFLRKKDVSEIWKRYKD